MCDFWHLTRRRQGLVQECEKLSQDLPLIFSAATILSSFSTPTIKDGFATLGRLETLFQRRGRLPDAIKKGMEEQAKREHYGQVLPIEEIRELVMKAATIVRMPCACRWTISRTEARCCYGVSFLLMPGIKIST